MFPIEQKRFIQYIEKPNYLQKLCCSESILCRAIQLAWFVWHSAIWGKMKHKDNIWRSFCNTNFILEELLRGSWKCSVKIIKELLWIVWFKFIVSAQLFMNSFHIKIIVIFEWVLLKIEYQVSSSTTPF